MCGSKNEAIASCKTVTRDHHYNWILSEFDLNELAVALLVLWRQSIIIVHGDIVGKNKVIGKGAGARNCKALIIIIEG